MNDPIIFLTEANENQRARITNALRRIPFITISTFDTLSAMRKGMRVRRPDLIIGPWAQGGETLLAARATMIGSGEARFVPKVLMLTDRISPARISLTRQAGDAELIPSAPLDCNGLYNRVVLTLRGASGLIDSMDDENSFTEALEHLPALKRRLAA